MSQTASTGRQERRVLQVRKKRLTPKSQKRILPSNLAPENDARHNSISSAYVEKFEEHAIDLSNEAHRAAVVQDIERRSYPELRLVTGSPILTQRHLLLVQTCETDLCKDFLIASLMLGRAHKRRAYDMGLGRY
jgi:hypothetical protein